MGLWGLEVKPEKPQLYHPKNEQGKLLYVTQARLGAGLGKEKCVVHALTGDKSLVRLCSLTPNKKESRRLDLMIEFEEPVEFSVTGGDRSIYLYGFLGSREQVDMYQRASDPKSGVVEDEDQPAKAEQKSPASEPESSKSGEKMDFGDEEPAGRHKKRNAKAAELLLDGGQESVNKSKMKKNVSNEEADEQVLTASVLKKQQEASQTSSNNAMRESSNTPDKSTEKEDNKKKNKSSGEASAEEQPQVNNAMKESSKTPDKSTDSNEEAGVEHITSSGRVVRQTKPFFEDKELTIYPNGLRIDELRIGTGRKALPGDSLKENGEIFNSTNEKAPPFTFRLGFGKIVKGFDVGVTGMFVGGKRKITIPPAMGYGRWKAWKEDTFEVPPNSWLIIEVELVEVRTHPHNVKRLNRDWYGGLNSRYLYMHELRN